MHTVRDEAILLRRFPYSESSLVARVFSRRYGKVGLLARGAHEVPPDGEIVLSFGAPVDPARLQQALLTLRMLRTSERRFTLREARIGLQCGDSSKI